MIAKGWGSGNCFYMGVNGDFQTPGQHKFQCRDIGALAKSANLQLAFQYSISNIGKTCVLGDENTAENNLVKTIAKKLECTLSIGTYSAAKTSGTNWYTAKFETKIDGDGQTSKFGQWTSFIGVKDGYSSIGQNAANTDLEAGDTGVAAFVHIYLSFKDRVGARATGMREFPFDTSVTDKTLNFKTYGVGLKADATLTVTLPAADKFIASNSLNAFTSSGVFGLSADYATKAAKSGSASGVVEFEFAAAAWGGSCCITTGSCGANVCDLASGNLRLFATADTKAISHSYQNEGSSKFNAMVGVSNNAAFDMPTHLTTVRGRGGLGSSNQKLMDVFWVMTSSISASTSLQALLHFYIQVAAANVKTDAEMLVTYGFPFNTYSATADTGL